MTLSLSAVHAPATSRATRAGIATYFAVWAERRALARLSDSRLKDLGLSTEQVAAEVARPFWDIAGTVSR